MNTEFMPRWNVSTTGDVYIGLEAHTEHPFEEMTTLVWSHMNHYYALEEAGFKPAEILAVREAFLASWYLKGRFGDDAEIPQDIVVVSWSHDELVAKAKLMMRILMQFIPAIGADDGFFDYFPNAYSMVEQTIFNLIETGLLDPDEKEELVNHLSMTRQVAFVMRYHERDFWDLVNANGTNYEQLQAWIRRGWVVLTPKSQIEDPYHEYLFTDKFWDAVGLAPVPELTA